MSQKAFKYKVTPNKDKPQVMVDPILKFFNGGFLMPAQNGGDPVTPYSKDYLNNLRNEWVANYNKPVPYAVPRDDRFDDFYYKKLDALPKFYKTQSGWVRGLGTDMEEFKEGDKNTPPRSMGKPAKGFEWVEDYKSGPSQDRSQRSEYARLIRAIRNAESLKPIWNRDVKFQKGGEPDPKKRVKKAAAPPEKNPYKDIMSRGADFFRSILPVPDNVAQLAAKQILGDARMSNSSLDNRQKVLLWDVIQNAKKRTGKNNSGTEYQDYGNLGYGSPDDYANWFNRGKLGAGDLILNSIGNDGFKLASTIGRGRYWTDEKDPDTIYYTDVYDWNPSEKNFKGTNQYQTLRNYVRSTEDKNLNADKNEMYRMNFKLNKKEIDQIKEGIELENKVNNINRQYGIHPGRGMFAEGGNINFPSQLGYRPQRMQSGGSWLNNYTGLPKAQKGNGGLRKDGTPVHGKNCALGTDLDRPGGGGENLEILPLPDAYDVLANPSYFNKDELKGIKKTMPAGMNLSDWIFINREAARTSGLFGNQNYTKYTDEKGILRPEYKDVGVEPYYLFYKSKFPTNKSLTTNDLYNFYSSQPGGTKAIKEFVNKGYRFASGGDISIPDLRTPNWVTKYADGGVIKDNMGYWNPQNWGKAVEIDSNKITMRGVDRTLLGVGADGQEILMQPGRDYTFNEGPVTEYPLPKAQKGLTQQEQDAIKKWTRENTTQSTKPKITPQQFNQAVSKTKAVTQVPVKDQFYQNQLQKYGRTKEDIARSQQEAALPFLLATGAVAAPLLGAVGASAVPAIGAGLSYAPVASAPAATLGNLLTSAGVAGAITNLPNTSRSVQQAIRTGAAGDIGEAALNVGLTGLDLLPVYGPASRQIAKTAYDVAQHPLVSTLPYVVQRKAIPEYLGAATIAGINRLSPILSTNPLTKSIYKRAAQRIASYSMGQERSLGQIVKALRGKRAPGPESSYKGMVSTAQASGYSPERDLINNYIYQDARGFEESGLPLTNLQYYINRYGPLKKYKLDTGILKDQDFPYEELAGEAVIAEQFPFPEELASAKTMEDVVDKIREIAKREGMVGVGSSSSQVGYDDVAGNMKYVIYDPVTDSYKVRTQDIWKFTPEDYNKKWGLSADRLDLDQSGANVKGYLHQYIKSKEAALMDKAGKPFVLLDERPLSTVPKQVKTYEPLNMKTTDYTEGELEELGYTPEEINKIKWDKLNEELSKSQFSMTNPKLYKPLDLTNFTDIKISPKKSILRREKGGDVAIYGRRNYIADTPSFYKSGGESSRSWLNKYNK